MNFKFSPISLDTFVAPELSQLSECNIPSLIYDVDQTKAMVTEFIRISLLRGHSIDQYKSHKFFIVRRTQHIIQEYQTGRANLQDYIGSESLKISAYFDALYRFELVVQLIYQAFDIIYKHLNRGKFFKTNDGSPAARLSKLNNAIKHLSKPQVAKQYVSTVWLSNLGICTHKQVLKWEELAKLVEELVSDAVWLANPKLIK